MSINNVYQIRALRRMKQDDKETRYALKEEQRFQAEYGQLQEKAHMPLTLIKSNEDEPIILPSTYKPELIDQLMPWILIVGFLAILLGAGALGEMAINYTSGLPLW